MNINYLKARVNGVTHSGETSIPKFLDSIAFIYKAGRGLAGKTKLLLYETTNSEWVKTHTPEKFAKSVKTSNSLNLLGVKDSTKKKCPAQLAESRRV